MTIGVHLRRPEPATRRTSEGVSVIDGVTAHAYDRFARELEEAGGMTVSFVDPYVVPDEPDILCTWSDFDLEQNPASTYRRTILMETPGNVVLLVARLGLLGAVMNSEYMEWVADRPYHLDRSVMARRDIAESMDAVGDRVYSLDEYCYLRRDDWTSLPQVLNHYLRHP